MNGQNRQPANPYKADAQTINNAANQTISRAFGQAVRHHRRPALNKVGNHTMKIHSRPRAPKQTRPCPASFASVFLLAALLLFVASCGPDGDLPGPAPGSLNNTPSSDIDAPAPVPSGSTLSSLNETAPNQTNPNKSGLVPSGKKRLLPLGILHPVYPFAMTGLTAYPEETAEEILVRATLGDARASVLVVVGYARGIGGFPRSEILAGAWAAHPRHLAAPETMAFTDLFLTGEGILDDNGQEDTGHAIANCQAARESLYFDSFRQAGIFNAAALCAELAPENSGAVPELKRQWEEARKERRQELEEIKLAIPGLRALKNSQVRANEAETKSAQNFINKTSLKSLIFIASTTHNPDREPPDFDPALAVDVTAALRKSLPQIIKEPSPGDDEVHFISLNGAYAHLAHPGSFQQFREAHTRPSGAPGSLESANYYLFAFTGNEAPRNAWRILERLDGPAQERLAEALALYGREERLRPALAWTLFALERDGLSASGLKTATELKEDIEKRLSEYDLNEVQGDLNALRQWAKYWQAQKSRVRETYGAVHPALRKNAP